jgi:hypothetical protein
MAITYEQLISAAGHADEAKHKLETAKQFIEDNQNEPGSISLSNVILMLQDVFISQTVLSTEMEDLKAAFNTPAGEAENPAPQP